MKLYCKTKNSSGGFTLIEILIASVLVGIAVAALLASNRAVSSANAAGINLSTAEFLLEQIRELTAELPVADPQSGITTFGAESGETPASYDDVDDFNGRTFCPPIGINRQTLTQFAAFTQQITVRNVSPADLELVVPNHSSNLVRVSVSILYNGNEISSAGWIRARR